MPVTEKHTISFAQGAKELDVVAGLPDLNSVSDDHQVTDICMFFGCHDSTVHFGCFLIFIVQDMPASLPSRNLFDQTGRRTHITEDRRRAQVRRRARKKFQGSV